MRTHSNEQLTNHCPDRPDIQDNSADFQLVRYSDMGQKYVWPKHSVYNITLILTEILQAFVKKLQHMMCDFKLFTHCSL